MSDSKDQVEEVRRILSSDGLENIPKQPEKIEKMQKEPVEQDEDDDTEYDFDDIDDALGLGSSNRTERTEEMREGFEEAMDSVKKISLVLELMKQLKSETINMIEAAKVPENHKDNDKEEEEDVPIGACSALHQLEQEKRRAEMDAEKERYEDVRKKLEEDCPKYFQNDLDEIKAQIEAMCKDCDVFESPPLLQLTEDLKELWAVDDMVDLKKMGDEESEGRNDKNLK
ncbi:hypothetical protein DMENIID0001_047760 [Sergentomyia squamirostris]